MTTIRYFLPEKPGTVVDAYNAQSAAQGSVGLAMSAHFADYNGHHNVLSFNDHRQYWVGEYTWAGRNVFVRSNNFVEALKQSISEYNHQGKFAVLWVFARNEDEAKICEEHGLLLWSEETERLENAKWQTWKHLAVPQARSAEKFCNPGAIHTLLNSNSKEEFEAALYRRA
jgi:hypothetical protein